MVRFVSLRSLKNYSAVWKRDGGLCRYCGDVGDCVDHVIPHSYGGTNAMSNLVVACQPCNGKAHNLLFPSFEAKRDYITAKRFKRRGTPACIDGEAECDAIAWCRKHQLCWLET